ALTANRRVDAGYRIGKEGLGRGETRASLHLECTRQRVYCGLRGELASSVPAHAIRDGHERRRRRPAMHKAVLVVRPLAPSALLDDREFHRANAGSPETWACLASVSAPMRRVTFPAMALCSARTL